MRRGLWAAGAVLAVYTAWAVFEVLRDDELDFAS